MQQRQFKTITTKVSTSSYGKLTRNKLEHSPVDNLDLMMTEPIYEGFPGFKR